MKSMSNRFSGGAVATAMALVLGMAGNALGASGVWTNLAAGSWSVTNNWAGGIMADGAGFAAWFTNAIPGARTVTLDITNRTVGTLNLGAAGGSGGFTIAANTGLRLIFNNSGANAQMNLSGTSNKTDTISAPMALADSLDIANDAPLKTLTLSGTITSVVVGARTVANLGAGAAGVLINGAIGNGVGPVGVVQNSAACPLTLGSANTFTNGLIIKAGLVSGISYATAFGATNSLITLGDSTGSQDATLNGGVAGPFVHRIMVAAGNSGMAAISNTVTTTFSGPITLNNHALKVFSSASSTILSGGLAGTGTLTLATTGVGAITLSGAPVNPSGAITNSGTGSGLATLSGGVGSNVTAITEASTNSALSIITLPLEVNTNGTTLANLNPSGAKVLTVSGGVRGIGDLILKNNSSVSDGITISTTAVTNRGWIINAGSGPSNALISAILGTNVLGVVQTSDSSPLTLGGANTFTGGLFIKAGTVRGSTVANAFGANSSVITLGDTTGSANATLFAGAALVFPNPIIVASNNTGVATITDSAAATFSNSVTLAGHDLALVAPVARLTLSGGLSGAGNLMVTNSGTGYVTLTTLAVNHAGTITNTGSGSTALTISGGVGSNVTAITETSANSALTIDTTALTVNSNGTTLVNNNPGGSALFTVSGGVLGTGDLVLKNNSAITNGITLSTSAITNSGRIVNSGTGTGSTLISALIAAPVTGVVQDSATSRLILSGANTYSRGTRIDNGPLLVSNATGSATGPGAVNVNYGGILQGTGSIAGTVTNNHGGMLSPGLDGIPGGTLTVGNLVWKGGGIVNCEIANVPLQDAAAGIDYDQLLVTNTLTAVPGGSNLVIRLDSLNQTLAFDPARNYSLKVITCGAGATLNPTNVSLDTNSFLAGGVWSVTNLNNAIYVVYRGDTSPTKNYWRGTGNWSTATNWSLGHAPVAGEDVEFDLLGLANCTADLISNELVSITLAAGYTGTVTVLTKFPGQGSFTNLAIAGDCTVNGGALTHYSNTASEVYRLYVTVGGNLKVGAGAQINADAKGYNNTTGPGRPTGGGTRAGGSYGGKGGIESQLPSGSGPTYGSITSPTNLGSASVGPANSGGGAIQLNVAGTSTVNGVISAMGTTLNYGSSGGSVFLTTGFLNGNGIIRVHGGPSSGQFCSGGGGRIAVILTDSMDFGSVRYQAYTSPNLANWPGAAGTVYLQHTNHIPDQGKLIVDNNDYIPFGGETFATNARTVSVTLQNGQDPSSYTFSEIILTNGGVYSLDTNDTLTIASPDTIRGDPSDRIDGLYLLGGTLNCLSPFGAFSNYFLGVGTTNSAWIPAPASLTVGNNASLKLDVPFTLPYPLTIAAGGILDHSTNVTMEVYKVDLTINGDLNVQSGGMISADDAGYRPTYGPGKGLGQRWGAGYGGAGGIRDATNTNGLPYGSITAPTNIGSGGPGGWGSGGGAIKLNVNGISTVNGAITASATNSGSGGSGGSVFLTTGTLTGSGAIKASSVSGSWQFGGGGRVAVILTNGNDFGTVAFSACPGVPSVGNGTAGGAGTIYLETLAQGAGRGTLILDASNRLNACATFINSNVTDTAVGTLVITNGAVLVIESNQSLTVNGSWLNASKPVNGSITNWTVSFTSAPISTVFLASTNEATVIGTNTFFNLSCTSAVKTVRFTAGTTNTVLGQLALGGGATFMSTTNGSPWYLTLAPGGTQQIGSVRVKDSNAGGGQELRAGRGSANLGNNVHWLFPSAGTVIQIR